MRPRPPIPPREAYRRPSWAARHRYLPAVEGMRGLAALLVLGGHAFQAAGFLRTIGIWMAIFGVVVFFAISGFLLYRPFLAARTTTSVRQLTPPYLRRRAIRIFPAYWVALTALALWPGLSGDVLGGDWWIYYGLLQIYSPDQLATGLVPAWSLCVEVSFYLALPLLAILIGGWGLGSGRRHDLGRALSMLGLLAVLSLAWRTFTLPAPGLFYLSQTLLGTMSWFCVGMLLAVVQAARPGLPSGLRGVLSSPAACWPLAAVLFALLPLLWPLSVGNATHLDRVPILLGTVVCALAAGLLLGPAVFGDDKRLVRLPLANRAAIFLGTISYGIYLWHWPLVGWLSTQQIVIDSASRVLVLGGLVLGASIALGTASWFLIEKPLMKRAGSAKALRRAQAVGVIR